MAGKASIVFAHGRWADGSCFNKLIPTLQAEGHEVFASQHGLNSLESDVACVNFTINHVPGPVVLVGHSYGGTLFNQQVPGTAWKTKPSWYIVANNDRTVNPDLERFAAKRMGAKTYDVDSSHVPMPSQPEFVLDVIRDAARQLEP